MVIQNRPGHTVILGSPGRMGGMGAKGVSGEKPSDRVEGHQNQTLFNKIILTDPYALER